MSENQVFNYNSQGFRKRAMFFRRKYDDLIDQKR